MRCSNRFLPVGQAAGCLLVALAVGGGLFREAEAQIPSLQGMSVTSYSISATVASPGEPATLGLAVGGVACVGLGFWRRACRSRRAGG